MTILISHYVPEIFCFSEKFISSSMFQWQVLSTLLAHVTEMKCCRETLSVMPFPAGSAYFTGSIELDVCELVCLRTAEEFQACEPSHERSDTRLSFIFVNA